MSSFRIDDLKEKNGYGKRKIEQHFYFLDFIVYDSIQFDANF